MVDVTPIQSLTEVDDVTIRRNPSDNKLEVKDDGITFLTKMANGTAGKICGYNGSGVPSELSKDVTSLAISKEQAYWKFQNNYTEQIGVTAQSLTATGATFDASVFKFGTHSVVGSGGNNRAATTAIDPIWTGTNMSCEFWFRFASAGAIRYLVCLDESTGGGGDNWLVSKTAANVIQLDVGGTVRTGTTALSVDTWYHCVVTKSGTTWKIYINGAQEGADLTKAILVDNTEVLNLLGNWRGAPNTGNAWLGNIRFFDYALSTTEITNAYNTGTGQSATITETTGVIPFGASNSGHVLWSAPDETVPRFRAATTVRYIHDGATI